MHYFYICHLKDKIVFIVRLIKNDKSDNNE